MTAQRPSRMTVAPATVQYPCSKCGHDERRHDSDEDGFICLDCIAVDREKREKTGAVQIGRYHRFRASEPAETGDAF